MYTSYTMKDLDTIAKKEVDRLLAKGGALYYKSDNWTLKGYDFIIHIPVEMPSEEHFPMINITMTLTNPRKEEPDQTLTFAEYL